MSANRHHTEKLQSTVIISDRFNERRAQHAARSGDGAEPLEAGSLVGRYLTLSRVGVGGMGMVYRAHDTELNRTVALKVLPPRFTRNPEYVKRFHTEAQAQARLNSPHVVTLYELMEHAAGHILVLEYVEGETLERQLRGHGPLSPREAVRIFEQALNGLEHIHRLGVVHRDLKPGNIFLTQDGGVKLMDFGIARLIDDHDPAFRHSMVGTLLYIPPEQINGGETDARSDVYTLGISLFEAVTGRLPFERRSDYALMHAHVQEAPPSPKAFRRRLPRELEAVILKAIAKDPNRRFQSAAEFRAALLALGLAERRQRDRSSDIHAPTRRGRGRTSARAWGGAWFEVSLVAAVLLLALVLDIVPRPSQQSPPAPTAVAAPVKTVAPSKPAAAKKTLTARTENRHAPQAAPRQDKYRTLRSAWGG